MPGYVGQAGYSLNSEMNVEQLKEKIKVLTTNYSHLEVDLDSCKSGEKDLIQAHTRSQQEIKDCTTELEKKNIKCRSDKVSNRELILELKTNQTILSSELETYKNTYAVLVVLQRELNHCNTLLKNSIKRKQVLQTKYELVCPWTEWSSCSQTCWGTKTRTNKCSSDEQIQACNQETSCPAGK